jgi:hypothetical protein
MPIKAAFLPKCGWLFSSPYSGPKSECINVAMGCVSPRADVEETQRNRHFSLICGAKWIDANDTNG